MKSSSVGAAGTVAGAPVVGIDNGRVVATVGGGVVAGAVVGEVAADVVGAVTAVVVDVDVVVDDEEVVVSLGSFVSSAAPPHPLATITMPAINAAPPRRRFPSLFTRVRPVVATAPPPPRRRQVASVWDGPSGLV